METLWQDLRFGLRMLRRNQGFTAIAVLMLALGIGVNTTVLCWVETIVLDPLPGVATASSLVAIVPSYRGNASSAYLSYPEFQNLADLHDTFSAVVGSRYTSALLTVNGQSQWLYGRVVTVNVFRALGVEPEEGRGFLPEDDSGEGAHPVLIISHSLWQRLFGGDAHIIGRSVQINQTPFVIVGIAPPELQGLGGGLRVDFWAPLAMHNEILQYGSFESRTFHWVTLLARLRPGVSPGQAQVAASALASRLESAYPQTNKDVTFGVFPLWKSPVGGQADLLLVLEILLAVSFGVLLIVAVNVANLLLVRAVGREKEIVIRLALGARRTRLVRQLLTESLLQAGLGGAGGILLARWGVRLFSYFTPRTNLPYGYEFRLNASTLLFTVVLTLLTAVLFGLLPALQARGTNREETLRGSGRSSLQGIRHHRVRNGLVVSEIALALLLLVGAGLCLRGFANAREMDLGFDPRNLLCAPLSLVPNGYTAQSAKIFDRQLRARLGALPGVLAVGLSSDLPLSRGSRNTALVDVEGLASAPSEDRLALFNIVSPGYFAAMRIPLLAGRDFTDLDDASAQNVVVIDEIMARRFWPGLDPIGRRFRMAAGIAPAETFTVIGVVKGGKYQSLRETPTPYLYLSYEQRPIASLFMGVTMRTAGNPEQAVPLLRREIHALDPSVEPLEMQTMLDTIAPAFSQVRIAATFLSVSGLTALLLASLGIYGVMAYAVVCRTHEIGVRMALGAEPREISKLIVAQGARLALAGIAAGLAGAALLTRLLSNLLFGVSATDPATFLGVSALLAAVALLACYLPARQAMRVEPVVALRFE